MAAEKITVQNGKLQVPNHPIIPFIEGDGTGPDIWAASKRVLDAAVDKAYQGKKKIVWKEVMRVKKLIINQGNGFQQKHWKRFKNIWLRSKVH